MLTKNKRLFFFDSCLTIIYNTDFVSFLFVIFCFLTLQISSFLSVGILRVHFSSDFITFFVCILHKFAYSQIIQDGLEFQILGTI